MSARRSRLVVVVWSAVLVLLAGMAASSAGAETVYVKEGGTGGGTSWADAYGDLQDALDAAAGDPNQIWVAAGTYKPSVEVGGTGSRYQAFQMINGVGIYGGFAPTGDPAWEDRDPDTYITILSGDLLGNDHPATPVEELLDDPNRADNCYHVFYHPGGLALDPNAILEGFTITAGNASGDGSGQPYNHTYHGGGMYNYSSRPTVTGCTFTGNSASRAGGMYNNSSSPTVTGCTFTGNSAAWYGSGMFNDTCSPTVTGCTFSGNLAYHTGGGMHNTDSSPIVTGCTFTGNSAGSGGGIFTIGSSSSPTVTGCTFTGNSAGYGGGLNNDWDSSSTVTNCILWDNTATSVGNEIYNYCSIPVISYCDIAGCGGSGSGWDHDLGFDEGGNIDADPLFVTGPLGDYYLSQVAAGQGVNSPCVDAGSDMAANLGMDTYTTRSDELFDGGIVDMGYHYSIVTDPDVNGDGRVDLVDFGIVSGWWMDSPCDVGNNFCSGADIDHTGDVGLGDLFMLAGNWLAGVCFPTPVFGPNPADGASGVNTNRELSWSAGNCAASHNIYFGTSSPGEFQGNQTETTFDPGALELETMYYWRVDEVQADSSVIEGDVWSFTTRSDMLVGWWELDESEGGTAYDSSANGYNGTLNGDPTWRPGGGRIGGALEFDGVGDYVEIEGYKGISGSNPRTVTAWVSVEPNASTLSIVRWGTSNISGATWSNVINADGKLRAAVVGGSVVGDTAIDDDTWHHVAIVLPDKEDVKVEDILLYVDGMQEDTTISFGSQAIDTIVGMDVLISEGGSFDGLLDDVRIYNYALSEGEIGALAGVL